MSADDDSNSLIDLVIGNLFDKMDDKDENAIAMAQAKSKEPGSGNRPKGQKANSKEERKRIAEENERRHQEKLKLKAEREKAQKAKKATTGEDDAEFNAQNGDLHEQEISEGKTKKSRSRKRRAQEVEAPPLLVCYNCGNSGHLSEACSQERKCLNCK